MFEDLLKIINEIRYNNSEENYRALMRGDVSKSNYCRGYDTALTNIEFAINELDKEYADWFGDWKCR